MVTLGPRVIRYRSPDGREGDIYIRIVQKPLTSTIIGDDPEPLVQPTFAVEIDCDWFRWGKSFPASDELQSIFWAMWISDIYLQKICRDNEMEIFSLLPGDISDDLDVFKK